MEQVRHLNVELFNVTYGGNHIATISPDITIDQSKFDLLDILENFTSVVTNLLKSANRHTGIIYYPPIVTSRDFYQGLFEAAKEASFEARIRKIIELSAIIKKADKPIVAIADKQCNSFQLAPILWAPYIIATEDARISLPDSKWGLFPGLGISVYASSAMDIPQAAALLLGNSALTAKDATNAGLFSQMVTGADEAFAEAGQWILSNTSITKPDGIKPPFDENNFEKEIASDRKKTNLLFPGIKHCIDLMAVSKKSPLDEALTLEIKYYTEVLRSKGAVAIMRTMNYGIENAKKPESVSKFPAFPFNKIGVLGSGMMGSGIAYEIAKAGISVCLKDTDIALATKGKMYAEKCADKLIQLGKMTVSKKEAMLSLIQPTDKTEELAGSDFMIEAVFEDKSLKEKVIAESSPFLKMEGFFASNTTSLPITELASYTAKAESFIGMHFFSPVDRMPLVEIILGKETSEATLSKALQLALKLQKVPIVVRDSPAFFTSRIFFNYLLEAVTMLLEGVPALNIEQEAVNAGFAVSPLAVLDEISIPLMLHVYDQLPNLLSSQRRCYDYLTSLVTAGRSGRKSGKGFYNYKMATTGAGTKQIWQDKTLTQISGPIDSQIIQKRLLHVMALESYRCLDEGVLAQPIDGDIGSILGVGYATHTGGVFAHIDQVGIKRFVEDCQSFGKFGEQWDLPSSLRQLAEQGYSFYSDFTSNWPLAK